MAEIHIVKKLCGESNIEAAQLIKELVKHMEEIYILTNRELMLTKNIDNPNPSEDCLREIRSLARDSLAHAKSK